MDKLRALINGCSFSRGPISWPYFLTTVDQTTLTNLACAGAGNTYIHETTVKALADFAWYDLVLIMWTGVHRVDFKVDDLETFKSTRYSSWYQSQQNNWAEKITEPFDDQTLVEKDWIFGCGHYNGELHLRNTAAFNGIYRYQNLPQFRYHFLQRVIALQSLLKNLNMPYVFMFYKDYVSDLQEHENLCKLVDWNNCFIDDNINNIAVQNNWFDDDGIHPGIEAHQLWAEKLDDFIKERL